MRYRLLLSIMGCSAALAAAGSLVGCGGDGTDENPVAPASTGTQRPRRRLPEHLTPMYNPLPFHNGPVPQERGTDSRPAAARPGARSPGAHPLAEAVPGTPTSTLVLYDSTGPWGWLGELYAILAGNLASHFESWTAKPVVLGR